MGGLGYLPKPKAEVDKTKNNLIIFDIMRNRIQQLFYVLKTKKEKTTKMK